MRRRRQEAFGVDRLRQLVRTVVPARGRRYQHKCSQEVLAEVCHYAQARGRAGFSSTEMWRDLEVPSSQASTALAFLKEHSLIERASRRNFPGGPAIFEHAMTDYFYLIHLADGGEPDE